MHLISAIVVCLEIPRQTTFYGFSDFQRGSSPQVTSIVDFRGCKCLQTLCFPNSIIEFISNIKSLVGTDERMFTWFGYSNFHFDRNLISQWDFGVMNKSERTGN